MNIEISVAEKHLTRLIQRALRGEEIIITKSQQPLVKHKPAENIRRKIQFGLLKGKIKVAQDFNRPIDLDPDGL